jgi:DNA-binding NarL/FixJ family response regulator
MSDRGNRNRTSVSRAARLLKAVTVGGLPVEIFDAIRACVPVAGGLIGSMSAEVTGSVSHVVGLPAHVLEAWATTPLLQMRDMMAPLVRARPGSLISDRKAIKGRLRDELALLQVMDAAGLGESAGYKIGKRTTPSGEQLHRFLTVALDGGEAFTPSHREMFRQLRPVIDAALSRMAVPLIAHQSIAAQITEERQHGYLCVSSKRAVVEINDRARTLLTRYCRPTSAGASGGWLDRFVEQALRETAGNRSWHLVHPDNRGRVEISAHWLAKEVHAIGQDVTLLMLEETEMAASRLDRLFEGLSPRRREAAHLLLTTGLRKWEMADRMGISEGTVRKHVDEVFQFFDVHSRAELVELVLKRLLGGGDSMG